MVDGWALVRGGLLIHERLDRDGFAILPGFVDPTTARAISHAYDDAVRAAKAPEIAEGSTSTRVDLSPSAALFASLLAAPVLFDACRHVLRAPFFLSSFRARTVRPLADEQPLHADAPNDAHGSPLLGFIYAVDEFHVDNGATRFLAGSHLDAGRIESGTPVCAQAPAGSVILFAGSVWHGHGRNRTIRPRRSLQGAYARHPLCGGVVAPFR